jgi:hypothetical protein
MHYTKPESDTDKSLGGWAQLPESEDPGADLVQFLDNTAALVEEDATIFGIAVQQVPTCVVEVEVADDYIGGGAVHTQASSMTPGKFQLVMHTGGSGEAAIGGQARVQTIDLPTPVAPPTINTWAAIIE